jgi:hypothetical protein
MQNDKYNRNKINKVRIVITVVISVELPLRLNSTELKPECTELIIFLFRGPVCYEVQRIYERKLGSHFKKRWNVG